MTHSNWANIIANATERNLTRHVDDKTASFSFVDDIVSQDAALNDPANLQDVSLSAAWGYADAFFDAASNGSKTLDGIDWPEAKQLLLETAERIREGAPITENRVLRYSYL